MRLPPSRAGHSCRGWRARTSTRQRSARKGRQRLCLQSPAALVKASLAERKIRNHGRFTYQVGSAVHGRVDGLELVWPERGEHIVGRVDAAGRPANANAQPSERATSETLHDVAQAVVAAVAAALALAYLAEREIQV